MGCCGGVFCGRQATFPRNGTVLRNMQGSSAPWAQPPLLETFLAVHPTLREADGIGEPYARQ